ncbi:hypothetical protein Q5P01_000775 [Channa striata]|uniref:RING-type domain-containing protein n=1 Tax=Channa striata TaxID=64152 RepID=A0AA88LEP2_CHASR|nr:hypothetical protein Q5P01_000775 [Channa striata]
MHTTRRSHFPPGSPSNSAAPPLVTLERLSPEQHSASATATAAAAGSAVTFSRTDSALAPSRAGARRLKSAPRAHPPEHAHLDQRLNGVEVVGFHQLHEPPGNRGSREVQGMWRRSKSRASWACGSNPMFKGGRRMDKMCGVCLENVLEKTHVSERVFAILPNCDHCYCLACIRSWRKIKHAQSNTCPECRTESLFYVPSGRWVETVRETEPRRQTQKSHEQDALALHFNRWLGSVLRAADAFTTMTVSNHIVPRHPHPRPRRLLS